MKKYWTKEEEIYIKNNITKLTISEFAKHFNTTNDKIIRKIHRLGLNSKKARGIIWTQEEDSLLREHFEYAPKNYLMELFPNRTWNSIFQRGNKTLHLNRISQDKYNINYNFFAEWNEYSAYFLGFILTDGHIHYGTKKFLQIEVQKEDIDILQKLKELSNFEGKIIKGKHENKNSIINNYKCKTNGSVKMQINNAKIILDLIQKGVPRENKTYNTAFPSQVPQNMIKHFIRGAIDGDGSISFNKKHFNSLAISFYGSYDLVKGVRDNLNIICNNKISQTGKHCWRFTVSGKKASSIANWLYSDATVYLNRKYEIYIQSLIS